MARLSSLPIAGAAVLMVALLPAPVVRSVQTGTEPAPPNVVIILTDDEPLGLTDAMPVLRHRIKNLGATYTNYMLPTSLCCPSRTSLFTGTFAHTSGVWNNGVSGDPALTGGHAGFVANGNDERSLAVPLDDAGYRTGYIGKYLNGYRMRSPKPPGWDSFQAFEGTAGYYDYTLAGQTYGGGPLSYSTDVIAQRAQQFIARTSSEPLFLVVAPKAPHDPFTAAPRDADVSTSKYLRPGDFIGVNENLRDKPRWVRKLRVKSERAMRSMARQQHRSMLAVDDLVGTVLDSLRSTGRLANSLVIYTSDNGLLWGQHSFASKGVAYRQSTEVPLFMRWDGQIKKGAVRDRLALNVDVTATVADATDVEMPWVAGQSLLVPGDRGGFVLEASPQFAPLPWRPAFCGWRTPNRMFVRYATGEEELYFHGPDPHELRNAAHRSSARDVLSDMRSKARRACVPTPPRFTWDR